MCPFENVCCQSIYEEDMSAGNLKVVTSEDGLVDVEYRKVILDDRASILLKISWPEGKLLFQLTDCFYSTATRALSTTFDFSPTKFA